MSTQTLGHEASPSTRTAKTPTKTTTFIAIYWEYVQQALELCAGVSELDPKNAIHSLLKQLGSDLSGKIEEAITTQTTSSLANRRTQRALSLVTNTPAERFKIRKRAAIASEKLSNLKKAVDRAERGIKLFEKDHHTGRSAIIPLEEAEQLVKKAEESEGLKDMMSKIDCGLPVEVSGSPIPGTNDDLIAILARSIDKYFTEGNDGTHLDDTERYREMARKNLQHMRREILLKAKMAAVEKAYVEVWEEWTVIQIDANEPCIPASVLDKVYAEVERRLVVLSEAAGGRKRKFEEYAKEDIEEGSEEDDYEDDGWIVKGDVEENVENDSKEDAGEHNKGDLKKDTNGAI